MSGGAFDYLHEAAGDAADLAAKRSQLDRMARRLDELPHGAPAARATRDVLAALDAAAAASEALRDVWHAVEWFDSADYGEEQTVAVLARFAGVT
jgi:phage shock protein A